MKTFKQFLNEDDNFLGHTWKNPNSDDNKEFPGLKEKLMALVADLKKQLGCDDVVVRPMSLLRRGEVMVKVTPTKTMDAEEYSFFLDLIKSLVKHHVQAQVIRPEILVGMHNAVSFNAALTAMTKKTKKPLEFVVQVPT